MSPLGPQSDLVGPVDCVTSSAPPPRNLVQGDQRKGGLDWAQMTRGERGEEPDAEDEIQ
jgi:hypothetical protein